MRGAAKVQKKAIHILKWSWAGAEREKVVLEGGIEKKKKVGRPKGSLRCLCSLHRKLTPVAVVKKKIAHTSNTETTSWFRRGKP